jgi:hypothetical protein
MAAMRKSASLAVAKTRSGSVIIPTPRLTASAERPRIPSHLASRCYRPCASNATGQLMQHQNHTSILKDEAVEPPTIAIITRFCEVVVIILLR